MDGGEVLARSELVRRLAQQDDLVALALEGGSRDVLERLDDAHHADDRRWIDGAERVLVVERHIAAGDRRAERLASVAHSAHGFAKLVVDLGLSRIAEVEIVRDRQRPTTG